MFLKKDAFSFLMLFKASALFSALFIDVLYQYGALFCSRIVNAKNVETKIALGCSY